MKKGIFLIVLLSIGWQVSAIRQDTVSLDQKIGQMIMIGMQGTSVNEGNSIYKYVSQGIVGGVLLYEYNISSYQSQERLRALTTTLQKAAPLPLLISIDQEGGAVNRLKTKYGFKAMTSARNVGLQNKDSYSKFVARTIATACSDMGINVNYAPVLDLHNATCPVLGKRKRCFSTDPNIVAHIAGLYIDAHNKNEVKTVMKHFPGHGNSRTDSHLGIADVSKYWTEKELEPYKILIGQGKVGAIMTAHIINTQLDPSKLPATLSEKIMNDLLRKKMGYNGVIITDDMQMGAISKHFGFKESIKKAILAGVDILMFSNNIPGATKYSAENVHATIKEMVDNGEIPIYRINESYARIMAWKNGYAVNSRD